MNSYKQLNIYDKLPLFYEYLMRKIEYDVWAKYLNSIVRDKVKKDLKVLEIAAGNCSLSKQFKKYYPNIIATDLSINMLRTASQNNIIKVCCDMTSLPFKNKFGMIYSAFDSINYLTSKKKLLILFSEVFNLLDQKGIFTFDASLVKNSINHSKVSERKGKFKGIKFNQKSEYKQETKIHRNTFLIELPSGEKFKEIHRQKIFPFETYFEIIEKSGFVVLDCLKAFTYLQGNKDSERVQFILRKD